MALFNKQIDKHPHIHTQLYIFMWVCLWLPYAVGLADSCACELNGHFAVNGMSLGDLMPLVTLTAGTNSMVTTVPFVAVVAVAAVKESPL